MRIIGIDYETTGLVTNQCAVVEVGFALWDTEKGHPVAMNNYIVNDHKAPQYGEWSISKKVSDIDREDIEAYGVEPDVCIQEILKLASKADAFIASNGDKFDKPLQESFFKRYGYLSPTMTPWIDLIVDVPFGKCCKHRDLTYLAAVHGFVNPWPHRALPDTLTMLKIFQEYNAEEIFKEVTDPSPIVSIIANVPYQKRNLASERGFHWTGNPTKKWVRHVKESWLDKNQEILAEYPFDFDLVASKVE